jgi:hypothetical protein
MEDAESVSRMIESPQICSVMKMAQELFAHARQIIHSDRTGNAEN